MDEHLLLPHKEILSVDFISFLVHKHPEYRQPIVNWREQVKASGPKTPQALPLFLQIIPSSVLKSVQEEFIKRGKPQVKRSSASGGGDSSSSMASQQPRPPGQQQGIYQQQQQQLVGLVPNMPGGAPPRGQQFQGSNNAWANNPPQQQRTVSPGPGQQAGAAVTAVAFQVAHIQGQIAQVQQAIAGGTGNETVPVQGPAGQKYSVPAAQYLQLLQQQLQQQQQQQALLAQLQQQQQQQARSRPGSAGATSSAVAPAATAAGKKPQAPGAGVAGSGSAGNLAGLLAAQVQAAQQRQQGAAGAGLTFPQQQRPPGAGAPGAYSGALGVGAIRPAGIYQPGIPGALARPGFAGAAVSAAEIARQHLASLQPGEAPKLQPPEGYEWVLCSTGWFALPKAKAEVHRAQAKRRAEDVPAGQPAAKVGGAGRRRGDDDVTAGAGVDELDVLGTGELAAELARSEAAKGAVLVEQGNVQEEYILNQDPTMALLAGEAKRQGVRSLGEGVFAFLSLATERHLTELLHNLVKTRLQREDLGKNYKGRETHDDRLRSQLFAIQKREKEAARKREEEERDELAKLGQTRKKLAEEDKKAAKAAQSARALEQQQKNLSGTLTKMGIGRRGFGTLSALGRPATGAGQQKAGFTKPELAQAKAAAAGADGTAADGAAANGPAAATAAAAGVKAESGTGADAAGTAAGTGAAVATAGAAGSSVPQVKPVTLQHELLNASNASQTPGAAALAFVAGGASTGRGADGEEGLRELMLADLIAVLERHPLYCKSQQLYTLYALAGK